MHQDGISKCFDKITKEENADILAKFLDLSSKNEQDLHFQHLIDVFSVKKRRPRKEKDVKENDHSYRYYVMVGSRRQQVCFQAFLSLHAIKKKPVRRLQVLKALGKSPVDIREKHVKKAHLLETKLLLREHIESFPQQQIQYASKTYNYLDARLNKKLLCKLYNEKHSNNKVSKSYFGRFFYENFNLHFGVPQSDCCCTCEELKVKLKSPHLSWLLVEQNQRS